MQYTLKFLFSTLVMIGFALTFTLDSAYAGKKDKGRYCGSGYVYNKHFKSCVPDTNIGIDQDDYVKKIKEKNKKKNY